MATQQGAINQDEDKELTTEEAAQVLADARKTAANSRLLALTEVSDQQRAERDAELGITSGEEKTTKLPPEVVQDIPVKGEVRKLKVDGKEIEVELDKIIEAGTRTLQKQEAADKRLEEATRILKEAQAQAEAFKNLQPPKQDVEVTTNQDALDVDEMASKLIDGDREEVKAVLSKVLGATAAGRIADNAQTLSPAEIQRQVMGALETQKAIDLFKTNPEQGGYADLYNDPILQKLVLDKEEAMSKTSSNIPAVDRPKQVASEVREWRDSFIPKNVDISGFDAVKGKKDTMATSTTSAGSRPAQKPTETLTPEQRQAATVEEMAKLRGQRTR